MAVESKLSGAAIGDVTAIDSKRVRPLPENGSSNDVYGPLLLSQQESIDCLDESDMLHTYMKDRAEAFLKDRRNG